MPVSSRLGRLTSKRKRDLVAATRLGEGTAMIRQKASDGAGNQEPSRVKQNPAHDLFPLDLVSHSLPGFVSRRVWPRGRENEGEAYYLCLPMPMPMPILCHHQSCLGCHSPIPTRRPVGHRESKQSRTRFAWLSQTDVVPPVPPKRHRFQGCSLVSRLGHQKKRTKRSASTHTSHTLRLLRRLTGLNNNKAQLHVGNAECDIAWPKRNDMDGIASDTLVASLDQCAVIPGLCLLSSEKGTKSLCI